MAYRGTGLTPFFSPTTSLTGLRRDLDRLFGNEPFGTGRFSPAVDVREDTNEIDVDFELPGINPDDVDVSVENGVLTVSGEKRTESTEGQEEGGRYHYMERSYGSFVRSFTLPQGVNEDQIKADFHNGVLTVRIPKSALPQPRRIQIQGGGESQQVQTSSGRETASGRKQPKTSGERERMVAEGGPEHGKRHE